MTKPYISKNVIIVALALLSFSLNNLSAQQTVQVFVLAGQSNMQGYGKIYEGSNGFAGDTVSTFTPSCTPLPPTTCDFTFDMADSYGDGWNGWTYDFVQNGVVAATETLSGGFAGTATITLEHGVTCYVIVNTPGACGGEVSWTLTNPAGVVEASLTGANGGNPAPNTLVDVLANDTSGQWSMLGTNGNWSVLDDAYLYFDRGSDTIRENVTVGQGAFSDLIGPELMFAQQIDAYYVDPILIVKTAWGGLSLAEDFRPPSAGGTTGPYYTKMIETLDLVTQNIGTEFPDIGITDFEIAGFAWFQGWNDGASNAFLNEYESNLHHLVNDVRNDLGLPNLPVVIASSGHGGYGSYGGWIQDIQDIVSVAQENVGCNDTQYGGTVGFVDTKPFWIENTDSPDEAGHHYHNNALSFLNIGRSIGDEMILAVNDMAFCSTILSVNTENGQVDRTSIYPNPTKGNLRIDLAEVYYNINVTVRNSMGKRVLQSKFDASDRIEFILEGKNGVYFIEITSEHKKAVLRIVKE